jgi:hypothetical protein
MPTKEFPMRRVKVVAVVALGVLALVAGLSQSSSLAQTQPARPAAQAPAPEWLSVTVAQIKPDLLTEWQDFQKNETIPALQKAGIKWRSAWQAGVFGENFTYVFVQPIEKFAQYDGDSPIVKALGAEGARAYGAKNRRFVSASRAFAVRTMPELSYIPDPMMTPKLAVLTEVTVAQGRDADYENYIKTDLLPVMKKAQVSGYSVSRTIFGGNASEYTTLRYINNFAELDQPPVTVRILGEAAASKLGAKLVGIVTSTHRSIIRYNTDLSFRVKTTSDAR